jgi:hypothetical protein
MTTERPSAFLQRWAWEGPPEPGQRGCSLGNPDCFLRADSRANLDGFWLAVNGRWYSGELTLRLPANLWTLRSVVYAPAYQAAVYASVSRRIEQRLFVPAEGAQAILWLRGAGFAAGETLELICDWRIAAARSETHRQQPHRDCERQWGLDLVTPAGLLARPHDAGADRQALEISHPFRETLWAEPSRVRLLLAVPSDSRGSLEFWVRLRVFATLTTPLAPALTEREERGDTPVAATSLPALEEANDRVLSEAATDFAEAERALTEPLRIFWAEADSSTLIPQPLTPGNPDARSPEDWKPRKPDVLSPAVQNALAWGVIGSRRVWHRYGTGDWGFTNDPPGNVVVTRDAAWFALGADHFAPDWSWALLETLCRHAVYPEGKVAEYVRLNTDEIARDDYGLNLNDATPLFLLMAEHHWRTVGRDAWSVGRTESPPAARQTQRYAEQVRRETAVEDRKSKVESLYPLFRGAAEWILRQRGADGLVWCDGRGTNAWGTASWRNIIPGYRLAGAVTELNALCVAALRAAARLAQWFGEAAELRHFQEEAARLDAAMAQLVDPQTGYFLLNRDENGPNAALTVDLAFPALCQAGPEEARVRTLLRLAEPDFLGPRGVLTIGRNDPAYHPRFGWGLMGGSWPNATAWVAAALAPYRPALAWDLAERIARALRPQTGIEPGVSVPGQFPEWFDGDTGESAGMSLSPWMPATYVWLICEGLVSGRIGPS